MEFKYTEDQIALRRAVREWAQSYLAPKAEEIDVNNRFPTETIEALGEAYPEELGGAGYDAISEAIAMEEISAACAATGSIITGHYLGFDALYLAGTPEQKEKWLRPALEGEKYAAFCLTEPAGGSDMTSNKTTAVEDGDDYVINGVKHFITGGAHCDFLCCFAITNKEDPRHGMTCFVVEKGNPGMKIASEDNKMGIRGARTAEIVFEDCRVPKANMVGELNKGYRLALDVVDRGRIGIAAQALGLGEGAVEEAIKYTQERVQFHKRLSQFQNTQFQLADMHTRMQAAQFLVYSAAMKKQNHEPYSMDAAMAKLFAAESASDVTRRAVQLFGGYGYTREYPVERMMRDAKITEIYEGTSEVQRMVISGRMGVK